MGLAPRLPRGPALPRSPALLQEAGQDADEALVDAVGPTGSSSSPSSCVLFCTSFRLGALLHSSLQLHLQPDTNIAAHRCHHHHHHHHKSHQTELSTEWHLKRKSCFGPEQRGREPGPEDLLTDGLQRRRCGAVGGGCCCACRDCSASCLDRSWTSSRRSCSRHRCCSSAPGCPSSWARRRPCPHRWPPPVGTVRSELGEFTSPAWGGVVFFSHECKTV